MSDYLEKYNKVKEKYIQSGGKVDERDTESELTTKLLAEVDKLAYVPEDSVGKDAPQKLDLVKLEDDARTEEDIKKEVEALIEAKYGKAVQEKQKLAEEKIEEIDSKKLQNATQKSENEANINQIYDNYVENAENQALKRGLARSSIIINQLDGIEQSRADELSKNATEYMSFLRNLEDEIFEIETALDEDLSMLELDKASEHQKLLNEKTNELAKTKKEIAEFNNNVEKMQAEYQLKKQSTDQKNVKTAEEILNKENDAKQKAREEQYNLILKTLKAMGKEQGLNELFSNPRYAEYLKHDIDDLYYNLRYMK